MSTYSEFALKVINYICNKYHVEYRGVLDYQVTPDTDTGAYDYRLSWGLNQNDYPFIMQGQFLNEDKFFEYIKKQITSTRFYSTEYFVARKEGKVDAYEVEGYKDQLLTFYGE